MKILDYNDTYLLLTNPKQQKSYLYTNPSFTKVSQCPEYYRIGSLQYSTGVVAFGTSSQVRFHDFLYERKIQPVETVLPLVSVKIVKNLLFCVSGERVLIYNLHTAAPMCHIPIKISPSSASTPSPSSSSFITTPSVSITPNYYTLTLLYPFQQPHSPLTSPSFPSYYYYEQNIWANKTRKIQCKGCTKICYDLNASVLCLVEGNKRVGLYVDGEVIRGCQFQEDVIQVIPSNKVSGKFYIVTEKREQPYCRYYLEFTTATKWYLKKLAGVKFQEGRVFFENQQYFQYDGVLHIVSEGQVFKTQTDFQPQFHNLSSFKELGKSKIDQFGFRISNVQEIRHSAQEERLEAQYLKSMIEGKQSQKQEKDEKQNKQEEKKEEDNKKENYKKEHEQDKQDKNDQKQQETKEELQKKDIKESKEETTNKTQVILDQNLEQKVQDNAQKIQQANQNKIKQTQ